MKGVTLKSVLQKEENILPGQHGQRRTKISDYGTQLREKQKARKSYGLIERQFRICFREAERQKGTTGEVLLQLLERRLDNVVFRMGFAVNRREARHLIVHGHFTANGKAINIPSYLVKAGDIVEVKETSRDIPAYRIAYQSLSIEDFLDGLRLTARVLKVKYYIFLPGRDAVAHSGAADS